MKTLDSLIEVLEKARERHGGSTPVILQYSDSRPIEYYEPLDSVALPTGILIRIIDHT